MRIASLKKTVTASAAAALLVTAPWLVGCSNSTATESTKSETATTEDHDHDHGHTHDDSEHIEVTAPWAKSAEVGGLTGMFAEIKNTGSEELTLVAATSDVAGKVELHEVSDGKMRAIDGGIKIPAGETVTLEPGGLHIMLMELTTDLLAGDEVHVTLEFSDGSKETLHVEIRDYAGAQEEYEGGHDTAITTTADTTTNNV